MSTKDDVLEAAALIGASAYRDRRAIKVLLDNADNRAVAEVLARWCAGWLRDAERLSGRSDGWWHEQLRAWAEHATGDDHPWSVP